MPHRLIDELIGESQDAFILHTLLKRHHWGRDFAVANAMADQLGWTRKRFAGRRFARTACLPTRSSSLIL
jgi:hypothetical protein